MGGAAMLQNVPRAGQGKVVFEFDLPEELQALEDKFIKKSVGLVKLEMRDEVRALENSGNKPALAGYLMVIYSLVEVDGVPVNKADGDDEKIVNGTDPAIRSLLVEAQQDISGTTKEQSKKFLGSRKTKVG